MKVKKYVCYLITNITNDKKYIGITQNFKKRKKQHFNIKTQKNENIKYDMEQGHEFRIEIIKENLDNKYEAEKYEYYMIQKYNSIKNGYNIVCSYIPTEIVEDITNDLLNNLELSYDEIAEKYGISKGTVYNINKGEVLEFEEVNYPIRLNTTSLIKTKNILYNVIIDLKNNEMSISEISTKYNVNPQMIHYINQNVGKKLYEDVKDICEELCIDTPINKSFVKSGINNIYNQ